MEDTDEPIEIALDVVEQSGIHVGDEVTTEILKLLREDDMRWRVRQAALHLLSYRPRTEHELRIRLHAKGFHDNFVESCLRLLENQGLLNDHAFALAHVRSRIRFHVRGRVRLSQELRQKGVRTEIANRAIDEVFNDPQVKHLKMASPVHHPELGDISLVAQPVTLSDVPFRIRSTTPKLGEHSDEVLGAIGYTDSEIEQFRLNDVV